MKIILLIFFVTKSFFLFSQNCEKELIDDLKKTFDSICNLHSNTIDLLIDSVCVANKLDKDSISILYIPRTTYLKNIFDIKVDSTRLFCYVDGKRMIFDEIYIYKDTNVFAIIQKQFYSNNLKIYSRNFFSNLPVKLNSLNAELIFTIDWIDLFFFIKNNNLYVLETDKNNYNINYYLATEYIPVIINTSVAWRFGTSSRFEIEQAHKKKSKIHKFFTYIFGH